MSGCFAQLLRNLRLRAEGKPNAIDAMEDLRRLLAQEQKRRAEAELEITTLQRRLFDYENDRPRDARGRYAQKRGAATCKNYLPRRSA
ncbi:hypothetical protein [Acetobacter oryzoeni]|uniref:hypothetical protein n=1 Tax=Acetobacter oryzoeni TaxID=2500548 RepID=UPI003DAA22A1